VIALRHRPTVSEAVDIGAIEVVDEVLKLRELEA